MQLLDKLYNTQQRCIIAVDGTSGAGKGAISSIISQRFHFIHSQSSIFYRCLALESIKQSITHDPGLVIALSENLKDDQISNSTALYDESVTEMTSIIAAIPAVRQNLYHLQRHFLETHKRVVMDGRDIGTVIAPDADLKIYVTADIAVRAKRRYEQLVTNGYDADLRTILHKLEERDQRDQGRAVAPLIKAADAIDLDTTNYSIEEALEVLLTKI